MPVTIYEAETPQQGDGFSTLAIPGEAQDGDLRNIAGIPRLSGSGLYYENGQVQMEDTYVLFIAGLARYIAKHFDEEQVISLLVITSPGTHTP